MKRTIDSDNTEKEINNIRTDNNNKLEKKIKKYKNVIRDWGQPIGNLLKKGIGLYYGFIHGLFVFLGGIIVVFSNNIFFLCVLLFIISLDAFAIVVLHDCPLTQLEEKYFSISGKRNTKEFLHKLGIMHKCDHLYESQLEFVINMWIAVVCKILFIIVYRMSKTVQI
jgi:hypothetical protein